MHDKSIAWWVVFILLCVWQLPQLLVALFMIPFLGKLTLIADRHFNLCFIGEEMSGGISLGPISFVSKWTAERSELVSHEVDGHTVDSKIWGPLYLFIFGIPSLLNAAFEFTDCYYDFYTEKSANNHAGLEVNEYCTLMRKQDTNKKEA